MDLYYFLLLLIYYLMGVEFIILQTIILYLSNLGSHKNIRNKIPRFDKPRETSLKMKRKRTRKRLTNRPGLWRTWKIEDYCGPGLDNTRLFMSLTAGAGTRCMSLLSSSPNLTKDPQRKGKLFLIQSHDPISGRKR